MGADLIGVSYTEDLSDNSWSKEIMRNLAAHLTPADFEFLRLRHDWLDDQDLTNDDIKEMLAQAAEFLGDTDSHRRIRWTETVQPGNEHLEYVLLAASTWGDAPFDEYDEVLVLLDALERRPDLAAETPYVGTGIAFVRVGDDNG